MIVGNDISKYQGDVNFDIYKNNSNFLIVKATEGVGFTDPKFKRNQSECRRVKLPLGYYHFARPDLGNKPEAEAQYFLDVIGPLQEGETLALDYECPNQVPAHVEWCRKWLEYVFAKTGVKGFIYLNQSQVTAFNWKPLVDASYALWIAAYMDGTNFKTGPWPSAAMQQWTSSQKVPGIVGNVDGNRFFGDLATYKKYGYKPVTPEPPVTNWEQMYKDEIKAHSITKEKVTMLRTTLIGLITLEQKALDESK